jgi:hypothetical protein
MLIYREETPSVLAEVHDLTPSRSTWCFYFIFRLDRVVL